MKLENQVVSLELSRKLKELGVKQESLFWWSVPVNQTAPEPDFSALEQCKPEVFWGKVNWGKYFEPIAAFTVAELGEMLPSVVKESRANKDVFGEDAQSKYVGIDFFEDQVNDSYGWSRFYRVSVGKVQFREKQEANARAKMLIYLIENKLVDPISSNER